MQRIALMATVIMISCAGLLVAETGALFAVAEERNQEYRRLGLDFELAVLRAERQAIQARDHLDDLQAQDSMLAARLSYRRGLEEFYHDTLHRAFAVKIARLRGRINDLQAQRATDQVRQQELRYQRGLAPQTELINARIALRAALRDKQTAEWSLRDAQIAFEEANGVPWSDALHPRVGPVPEASLADWLAEDLALLRAETAAEAALIRRERLPRNATSFDRRIADANLERAEFSREQARLQSERRFQELTRRLQVQRETIRIRMEEMDLQRALARESIAGFERGMVTASARDQAQVQEIQARIQVLNAEQDFLATVVTYLLGLGETPGDVW